MPLLSRLLSPPCILAFVSKYETYYRINKIETLRSLHSFDKKDNRLYGVPKNF